MHDRKSCDVQTRKRSKLTCTGAVAIIALTSFGLTAAAVAGEHALTKKAGATTQKKSHGWLEVGLASWYGNKFQGHKTATGEKFDMNSLTCAHRTLPLGSWLRVTNLRNQKSIFVRVNDRGPALDDRVVDLSMAAAKAVGLTGISRVKLERVSAADPEMAKALIAQLTPAEIDAAALTEN